MEEIGGPALATMSTWCPLIRGGEAIEMVAGESGQEANQIDLTAVFDAMQRGEKGEEVFPPSTDAPIVR